MASRRHASRPSRRSRTASGRSRDYDDFGCYVEGDRLFCPAGLGRPAMVSVETAVERVHARHPTARLHRLPKHIRPYAEFMRLRADQPVTPRDVVKAYVLTRSSVQRQAISVPSVCKADPDFRPLPRAARTASVRPEDQMARLLFTPASKRYLDSASKGHFDEVAARALADRFVCFGLVYPKKGVDMSDPKVAKANAGLFYSDLRRGAELARKTGDVQRALRLPPEKYWQWLRKNVYGIGPSKAGFFASLFGRGDIPTFDAREIALWQRGGKKKLEPKWQDVKKLSDRFRKFPMELEAQHEPFRAHLVHHALWDAYSSGDRPTKTTHGSIIRSMQFAGLKRQRQPRRG